MASRPATAGAASTPARDSVPSAEARAAPGYSGFDAEDDDAAGRDGGVGGGGGGSGSAVDAVATRCGPEGAPFEQKEQDELSAQVTAAGVSLERILGAAVYETGTPLIVGVEACHARKRGSGTTRPYTVLAVRGAGNPTGKAPPPVMVALAKRMTGFMKGGVRVASYPATAASLNTEPVTPAAPHPVSLWRRTADSSAAVHELLCGSQAQQNRVIALLREAGVRVPGGGAGKARAFAKARGHMRGSSAVKEVTAVAASMAASGDDGRGTASALARAAALDELSQMRAGKRLASELGGTGPGRPSTASGRLSTSSTSSGGSGTTSAIPFRASAGAGGGGGASSGAVSGSPSKATPAAVEEALRMDTADVVKRFPEQSGEFRAVDKQSKRQYDTYREIVATEAAFVDALQVIVSVYQYPLEVMAEDGRDIIAADEIRALFSNAEQLLCVNAELLAAFARGAESGERLSLVTAAAFLKLAPYLRMYYTYCGNYWAALDLLQHLLAENDDFVTFCRYCRTKPQSRNLDLASFLIKPVQRITKYPLLFAEVLKRMGAAHPSRPQVEKAMEAAKRAADEVNEAMRSRERDMQLLQLYNAFGGSVEDLVSPGRVLVVEDDNVRVSDAKGKPKECHVAVLNDMVLVGVKHSGLLGGQRALKLWIRVAMGDITVGAAEGAGGASFSAALGGASAVGRILIQCSHTAGCTNLRTALSGAVEAHTRLLEEREKAVREAKAKSRPKTRAWARAGRAGSRQSATMEDLEKKYSRDPSARYATAGPILRNRERTGPSGAVRAGAVGDRRRASVVAELEAVLRRKSVAEE